MSWLCSHPLDPPHHLATALITTPCIVGMEHLVIESYKKLGFLFPGLFVLPELIAGEEGLSGVPCPSAETLALISQACKPSVDSSSVGSRGRGVPPVSCCGPLEHPLILAVPCTPNHAAALGCWGETCLELGNPSDSSAKPNSPAVGSHSRPVCPVPSSPHSATGTTRTIPPELH